MSAFSSWSTPYKRKILWIHFLCSISPPWLAICRVLIFLLCLVFISSLEESSMRAEISDYFEHWIGITIPFGRCFRNSWWLHCHIFLNYVTATPDVYEDGILLKIFKKHINWKQSYIFLGTLCLMLFLTFLCPARTVYWSAQAAVRKYHSQGSLSNRSIFSHSLESRSPRSWFRPIQFPVRALLFTGRWPPSCCVHLTFITPFLQMQPYRLRHTTLVQDMEMDIYSP